MTGKLIEARRKVFIREMVPVESVAGMIAAYKKAFPTCKKDETARVGAYALLRIPTIVKAIDDLKKERELLIKKTQAEEIQRLAREQIVSQVELEAILSRIATGKFRRKKVIAAIDIKSGKIVKGEVEEAPTETDMISAADKLFKIKGSYAAEKQVHEAGDSFIEIMKAITSKKHKTDVPKGGH